jgi:hypothetical protein
MCKPLRCTVDYCVVLRRLADMKSVSCSPHTSRFLRDSSYELVAPSPYDREQKAVRSLISSPMSLSGDLDELPCSRADTTRLVKRDSLNISTVIRVL